MFLVAYTIHTVFPNSTRICVHTNRCNGPFIACLFIERYRTKEQVTNSVMQTMLISVSNLQHNINGTMRSLKQFLASAVVKASLLLRCGDVEVNPGPEG